jgi:6-pyruvoyl-tetrahydropterin synthase
MEYHWDSLGNLTEVKKYIDNIMNYYEKYLYNERGQRVKTITEKEITIYIYDGLKLIYEKRVENSVVETKDLIYEWKSYRQCRI